MPTWALMASAGLFYNFVDIFWSYEKAITIKVKVQWQMRLEILSPAILRACP